MEAPVEFNTDDRRAGYRCSTASAAVTAFQKFKGILPGERWELKAPCDGGAVSKQERYRSSKFGTATSEPDR